MNGMLGGKPNQTFFMADRIRRQGNGQQRPLSIDEMNSTQQGIMLQSTNDSRIHDMLPTVSGQAPQNSNNKTIAGFNKTRVGSFGVNLHKQNNSEQMRQTMFNGNFMTKLRQSNAGQHQVNDADSGGMSSFGQSQKNDNGRIGTTNGVVTGQN